MDTQEAICLRASVRSYKQDTVKKGILEQLVDAGRRAPTARAVEPWEFIVITEKQTLHQLSGLIPNGQFIKDAAAGIVVACEDTKYYLEDGSAATENILLAATELGLGACWIAGDKKPYANELLSIIGAPRTMKLISIISVGWPIEQPQQKKRRALQEVIHWQRF